MNLFWAAAAIIIPLTAAAVGDMISDEIRARLDKVPFALLGLAGRLLPAEVRKTVYEEEWLPELYYILQGEESRPITRLIIGCRYSAGLLVHARSIGNTLLPGSSLAAAAAAIPTRGAASFDPHPSSAVNSILRDLEHSGWTIMRGPHYYQAHCPCSANSMIAVHRTPMDPNYARRLRSRLANHGCACTDLREN